MKITKFLKPEKLVEYFDQEIQESLFNNGLRNIEFIGWQNQDTVNPNYLGYAEQLNNPRIKFDLVGFALGGKTFPNTKDEVDIEIKTLGTDFIEAMKGAHLMLGQSLFFSKHQEENISPTYGSINLSGAVFLLGIAADRIRDYYVYAVTGKSFDEYKNSAKGSEKNNRRQYLYFFSEVLKSNSTALISSWQQQAYSFALEIEKHRHVRNSIAHALASPMAEFEKAFFKSQKDGESTTFPDDIKLFSEEIPANIEWYKLLVELGNLVFLIEAKTRKNEP